MLNGRRLQPEVEGDALVEDLDLGVEFGLGFFELTLSGLEAIDDLELLFVEDGDTRPVVLFLLGQPEDLVE